MKILLNFADENYRTSQQRNTSSGLQVGGFDLVLSYHPDDIDPIFQQNHRSILGHRRGAGYWLWKPYFILRCLLSMKEGDFLFYADAGSYFVNPIAPLIQFSTDVGQDVMFFENPFIEKQWTKRDAFVLMGCDTPEFTDTRQRGGGFSLWRKSPTSMAFASQYLQFATDERIISDKPNVLGLPNYAGFRENRHDQTVSSLLCKRFGVPPFRFVDQRGNSQKEKYPNSRYPQIVQLTRLKDK